MVYVLDSMVGTCVFLVLLVASMTGGLYATFLG